MLPYEYDIGMNKHFAFCLIVYFNLSCKVEKNNSNISSRVAPETETQANFPTEGNHINVLLLQAEISAEVLVLLNVKVYF